MILNYFPSKKGMTHHLNKFNFPLLKDALCPVKLSSAQWFWRNSGKCKRQFTDRQTDGQNPVEK